MSKLYTFHECKGLPTKDDLNSINEILNHPDNKIGKLRVQLNIGKEFYIEHYYSTWESYTEEEECYVDWIEHTMVHLEDKEIESDNKFLYVLQETLKYMIKSYSEDIQIAEESRDIAYDNLKRLEVL